MVNNMRKNRTLKKGQRNQGTQGNQGKGVEYSYEKELVCRFLEILHAIKLFHWRTTSYAIHKATCELHAKLSENIDSFVEIMIGKNGVRVDMSGSKTMDLFSCTTPDHLKELVQTFKAELIAMNSKMDTSTNSDLLNIRDEMVGQINQFLYLLTLS
jgi:hypothetical protein